MKTLVEQLREMVCEAKQGRSVSAWTAETEATEAILGRKCRDMSDEYALFTIIADRIESEYMPLPLDADGMPIKPGDNVFFVEGNEPHEVFGFDYDNGELEVHIGRHDGTSTDAYVKPGDLTHELNTLERIEKDAMKRYNDYWGCGNVDCFCCPAVVDGKKPYERYATDGCIAAQKIDLLHRQREVLESGQA